MEGSLKPEAAHYCNGTSVGDLGAAEVTAATTASAPSSHRTRTGRFFEAVPFVNVISAIQNSPARTVIVQPFIVGGVAAQERAVIAW